MRWAGISTEKCPARLSALGHRSPIPAAWGSVGHDPRRRLAQTLNRDMEQEQAMTWTDVRYDMAGAKVLITGGTSGLGAAIARAYAGAGAEVAITGTRASPEAYDTDLLAPSASRSVCATSSRRASGPAAAASSARSPASSAWEQQDEGKTNRQTERRRTLHGCRRDARGKIRHRKGYQDRKNRPCVHYGRTEKWRKI